MDKLKLEYTLKRHEIPKQAILDAEGWGTSTYYRKMAGESDWTIEEVNNLIKLGVTLTETIDIFFK